MRKRRRTMSKWKIDPDHSVAAFAIRHMMVVNIRGQFNSISGTIDFNPADISRSSVEVAIEAASLTTGNRKRDEHLLTQDFFEISKYPLIVFKSTGIEKTGNNIARVTGNLALHGVTRPVNLDVEYSGPVKGPAAMGGETTMGFRTSVVINRTEYGMDWNVPLEDGGLMLGKDVELTLEIEADLME